MKTETVKIYKTPSHELDNLVATMVMGEPEVIGLTDLRPCYSSNLMDALMVEQQLRNEGYTCTMCDPPPNTGVSASCEFHRMGEIFDSGGAYIHIDIAEAENELVEPLSIPVTQLRKGRVEAVPHRLPLAICRAALNVRRANG